MKIINIKKANVAFDKREDDVYKEAEALAEEISEAIASTDADSGNTMTLFGVKTKRVVFMDVSDYLPGVVDAVSKGFSDEGYVCSRIHMAYPGEGEDAASTPTELLCVCWAPRLCHAQDLYYNDLIDGDEGGMGDDVPDPGSDLEGAQAAGSGFQHEPIDDGSGDIIMSTSPDGEGEQYGDSAGSADAE